MHKTLAILSASSFCKSTNALFASGVRWNLSCFLSCLKKSKPHPPSRDMNLLRAVVHLVSFWMSFIHTVAFISVMAVIFSRLASIPRWLMMKLSSSPDSTPKTYLVGLSFHRNFLKLSKVSCKLEMKSSGFLVLTTTSSTYAFTLRCSWSLKLSCIACW